MEEEQLGKKFNTAIKEIRDIRMTADEKKRILENVLNSPVPADKPTRSPWTVYMFASYFKKNKLVSYTFTSFLIIIIGSTGLVYASNGSLPGNLLYPIKVGVVEPVHSALTFSTGAKAEYESSLAEERLIEAETLADMGKLDVPKENKLNSLLESHTASLNKSLDKLRRNSSTQDQDDDIVTNFQASMNAHARILDVIQGREVSTQDDANGPISKNARNSAGKIRDIPKKRIEKSSENYAKRKNTIQSLIDSTASQLDKNTDDSSPRRKTIFYDTHQTLDQAKQFLKEADEEDVKGDKDNAYSRLLDSESSAKEADIFLNTGLKFKTPF